MRVKERILAGLKGLETDKVPLTVYDFIWQQVGLNFMDERVDKLCKKGLGIIRHIETYSVKTPDIICEEKHYTEGWAKFTIRCMRTPVGDVTMTIKEGWVQEYYLKSPKDYKVMEFIARNQIITPNYEAYALAEKEIGEQGIIVITVQRSPFQKMMIDLAGLEEFSYHLADGFNEFYELHDTTLMKQKEIIDIVASGPGEIVKSWENVTGDVVGPGLFERFHMPYYNSIYPVLESAGKLLCLHFDGKLTSLQKSIKKAPFDIIESFTPPPEGDMTFEVALSAWENKSFWLTIPAHAYDSSRELGKCVEGLVHTANGKRLVLEIAEYFPEKTWESDIAVILDVLNSVCSQ